MNEIVGGAVPREYIPAVNKGIEEQMQNGVLAGYPLLGLKATLYDGSFHDVDSSEMAFKIAASMATKKLADEGCPARANYEGRGCDARGKYGRCRRRLKSSARSHTGYE